MKPYPHVIILDVSLTRMNMSNQEINKRKCYILCTVPHGHYRFDISELLEFAPNFVVVNWLTGIFQSYYETTLVLLTWCSETGRTTRRVVLTWFFSRSLPPCF